jgi:hypothetical protein
LPLPEKPSRKTLYFLVLKQEIRSLLCAPALWLMLILTSALVGFSFIQAVALYGQASRTALNFPALAAGMTPLEGVFVPTFGGYYLVETLLLPFVAIRLLALDKQSGSLKLLLQLPLSTFELCGLKLAAMVAVGFLCLLPALTVAGCWLKLGGHLYLPELLCLLAGHALYFFTVTTLAMLAASISRSLPTAAMVCLAATLGSWVLDFSASGSQGVLKNLARLTPGAILREFENGLLRLDHGAVLLGLGILFFLLAAAWLHPGKKIAAKVACSLLFFLLVAGVTGLCQLTPESFDLTENRKHSFDPATCTAMARLDRPLTLTIHLDPRDGRRIDLENDLLAKLRRAVPRLVVKYRESSSNSLFQAADDDRYGLIEFSYAGRHAEGYSNSPQEVLPMIYRLAGIRAPQAKPEPAYPGYPLVASARKCGVWFYLVWPLLFLGAGFMVRRGKW